MTSLDRRELLRMCSALTAVEILSRPAISGLALAAVQETPSASLDCSTTIDPIYSDFDVDGELRVRTLSQLADLRRRATRYIFGDGRLPATLPVARASLANPLEVASAARTTELTVSMTGGFASTLYLFEPRGRPRRDLVVVHQGHTTPWNAGVAAMIGALLENGFAVIAAFLPLFPPNDDLEHHPASIYDHSQMAFVDTRKQPAIRIFIEPVVAALNYAATLSQNRCHMVGLSGGGWATTVCAALDPRILKSFPVAGSLPDYLKPGLCGRPDIGDWEQGASRLYRMLSYLDLYVMGSVGRYRKQIQCLIQHDPCCFAGVRYRTYEPVISRVAASLGGSFGVKLDTEATVHGISDWLREQVILPELLAGSDGGR